MAFPVSFIGGELLWSRPAYLCASASGNFHWKLVRLKPCPWCLKLSVDFVALRLRRGRPLETASWLCPSASGLLKLVRLKPSSWRLKLVIFCPVRALLLADWRSRSIQDVACGVKNCFNLRPVPGEPLWSLSGARGAFRRLPEAFQRPLLLLLLLLLLLHLLLLLLLLILMVPELGGGSGHCPDRSGCGLGSQRTLHRAGGGSAGAL